MLLEREIPGFPGYKVRNDGVVIGKRGRPLKPGTSSRYNNVQLCRDNTAHGRAVHVLVAKAFVVNPRPDLFNCVDHIDRNTRNNHSSNLRWVNRQLNSLNQKSRSCKKNDYNFCTPYLARVEFNGKKIVLGYYTTEEHAIHMMNKHREKLFIDLYNWYTRPWIGSTPHRGRHKMQHQKQECYKI